MFSEIIEDSTGVKHIIIVQAVISVKRLGVAELFVSTNKVLEPLTIATIL